MDSFAESTGIFILTTRTFAVPRARLFAAFSDPDQLRHWWGPKGFTNTFHEFDMRPGGTWRFVMHGPEGADYPNENRFLEVIPPERIVIEHPDPRHHFQMTMTFEEEDATHAKLSWRMHFASAEHGEKMRSFISEKNQENFDRLEALLSSASEQGSESRR